MWTTLRIAKISRVFPCHMISIWIIWKNKHNFQITQWSGVCTIRRAIEIILSGYMLRVSAWDTNCNWYNVGDTLKPYHYSDENIGVSTGHFWKQHQNSVVDHYRLWLHDFRYQCVEKDLLSFVDTFYLPSTISINSTTHEAYSCMIKSIRRP